MAIGGIDLTTMSRAQDYTAIKQNEDNKGMMDQVNLVHQGQKNEETKATTVHDSANADWYNKKQDGRDKGNNEYAGDGGRKREKKATIDRVVVKGRGGFDLKI
ncbi:MAG: hypothetical protein J6M66_03750 [Lachnospiraceae bacterium]|nr:hypothetical protein [Lachnospiraceae bacterium]